eukprot:1144880-Pelagomonas_calceolata.AAC.1
MASALQALEKEPHWFKGRKTPHHKVSRSRGARQPEKEGRSSDEKESKMRAERLEFQAFMNQHEAGNDCCTPSERISFSEGVIQIRSPTINHHQA